MRNGNGEEGKGEEIRVFEEGYKYRICALALRRPLSHSTRHHAKIQVWITYDHANQKKLNSIHHSVIKVKQL